jgi:hypothetical protein
MAVERYKQDKTVSQKYDLTSKDKNREQEQDKMEVWKISCKQKENIATFCNILHCHQEIKLGCHQLVHSGAGKDKVEWTKRTSKVKCQQRLLQYGPEKNSLLN